jgi:hypothetical protein
MEGPERAIVGLGVEPDYPDSLGLLIAFSGGLLGP